MVETHPTLLEEHRCVPLLVQDDLVLRLMFGILDLFLPCWLIHLRNGIWILLHSLAWEPPLHWVSEHGIRALPKFFSASMAVTKDVSFPDVHRTQNISFEGAGRTFLFTKLVESWLVCRRYQVIFNHRPKDNYWHTKWFSKAPFMWSIPVRSEVFNFAQITATFHWNQRTVFHPVPTAEVSLRCLLSPCVPLFLRCRLSRLDGVLTYNDSIKHLQKLSPNSGEWSLYLTHHRVPVIVTRLHFLRKEFCGQP